MVARGEVIDPIDIQSQVNKEGFFVEKHATAARPFGSAGLIVIIVLLLLTVWASGAGAAGADAAGTVALPGLRCEPGEIVGVVGQPVAFDLYVAEIAGLWGADVRMAFDPAMAQLVDADPDAEGIQIEILDDFLGANFVLRQHGDNDTGEIRYAVTYLNGPWDNQPATGSGSLARVTLEPLQAGSFVMPFTYYVLNDVDGFEIEVAAVDCPVTFTETPAPVATTHLPLVFTGIVEPPPFKE